MSEWQDIEIVGLLRDAVSCCVIYKDGSELTKTQNLFDDYLIRHKEQIIAANECYKRGQAEIAMENEMKQALKDLDNGKSRG